MLNHAIDDGVIDRNPALGLGRQLKLVVSPEARQENIKAFGRAGLFGFLDTARRIERRWYPLFLTLARSGMRLGEALALRWENVDFEHRVLRVARNLSKGMLGTPKSGHGRDVDMSGQLTAALSHLSMARKQETLKRGWRDVPPWVFCSESGGLLDDANVRRAFRRVLKAAKLPLHFTPHCLRHTYASLLLQQGESPEYVKRQLGHASIELTVDTYGKWLPRGNKAAVDRLDDQNGSKLVANGGSSPEGDVQVPETIEATRRNRTGDLLITNQYSRFSTIPRVAPPCLVTPRLNMGEDHVAAGRAACEGRPGTAAMGRRVAVVRGADLAERQGRLSLPLPKRRRSALVEDRAARRRDRRPAADVEAGREGPTVDRRACPSRRQAAAGSRPAEDREAARLAAASSPTVEQEAERWLARLEAIGRSEGTLHEYRRLLTAHVFAKKGSRDRLGSVPCRDVTARAVEAIHTRLRKTPTQANRLVDVLSSLFTAAHVEPNPALRSRVERYEHGERKRERHLTDDELAALGAALRDAEKSLALPLIVIGFFRLLLLTGCRPGELTRLRWSDVDLDAGRIWLGRTKTKSRDPRAKPA